jgi:hypothetical protein
MSKLVPFLFQILRKTNRRMICNNNNNSHYIKRSILRNRFHVKFTFLIRTHKENKLASNGYKFAWEESEYSLG